MTDLQPSRSATRAGHGRKRIDMRYPAAVVLTGLAAGLAGALLTLLLHAVQHVAFGYSEDTFLIGVEQAAPARRVVALAVGGALAGTGWWLQRRYLRRRHAEDSISVTHALAEPSPRLPLGATTTDAVLQLVAVGAGGSLGREGAPRQVGAALGTLLAKWLGLTRDQRRVVLAAGAGAGLAAVYNVPFGGAVFALECLLGTVAPSAIATALCSSGLATITAWALLGDTHATYQLPRLAVGVGATVAAVAIAPVLGAVAGPLGVAFRATMTYARTHAPHRWRVPVAITITFVALGAAAIAFPELLGNGKGLTQFDLDAPRTVLALAALTVLKPIVTAACLRAGAIGGLLTPSFATGATFGLLVGKLCSEIWPAAVPIEIALLGAAALLAVSQRAPLTALVLTVEFTHVPLVLAPAIGLAVAAATVSARWTTQAGRLSVCARRAFAAR